MSPTPRRDNETYLRRYSGGWRLQTSSLCFTRALAVIRAGETSKNNLTVAPRKRLATRFMFGSQTDRRKQLFSFDYVKVSLCFGLPTSKIKVYCARCFFHLWTCLMKPNKLLLEQHRAQNCDDGKLEDFQSWNLASPACQSTRQRCLTSRARVRGTNRRPFGGHTSRIERHFRIKENFFFPGKAGSPNSRKWEISKFNSQQYADCSSRHRARSKCFPRGFFSRWLCEIHPGCAGKVPFWWVLCRIEPHLGSSCAVKQQRPGGLA